MKWSALSVLSLTLIVFKEVNSKCGCRVRYKAVGCRKDTRDDRALPEMLINERDKYSSKYNGFNIDWFHWDEYLPAFTCRCAEAAMKMGYKYFGLQFWGECWSGPSPSVDETYEKFGKGSECYGHGYEKCTPGDDNCVGESNRNFVYKIETYDCPYKYERLGCYNDHRRPLSKYILTDRDPWVGVSSGRSIDWINFDTYLPDLACRCAKVANEKGYNTFGIQYYGECWSGPDGDVKYFVDGQTSNCVNQCYDQCHSYDPFCTGKGYTNFVYRITAEKCEIPYNAVGCYKEVPTERALNELILDDVNPQSSKFTGMISTDFSDWGEYMDGFVCRCARKIKEKGYTTFAITNGGECWSGVNAGNYYGIYGSSAECYYKDATPCTSETTCAGGKTTNFVYQLNAENDNTV